MKHGSAKRWLGTEIGSNIVQSRFPFLFRNSIVFFVRNTAQTAARSASTASAATPRSSIGDSPENHHSAAKGPPAVRILDFAVFGVLPRQNIVSGKFCLGTGATDESLPKST